MHSSCCQVNHLIPTGSVIPCSFRWEYKPTPCLCMHVFHLLDFLHFSTGSRPAYPKVFLSVLHRFFTRFFADAPPISQNKTVSKVNFSINHLVRTVCELTSSIIQTHYTQTTLFYLHVRKLFSIEDRRTLSPKTMHHVCCFRWCLHSLSWTVVVWSEFVSLVLCSHLSTASNSNPPYRKTANFHQVSMQSRCSLV